MSDGPDIRDATAREVVEPLHAAIGDRYLQYALSTIMNRALPDARDGLKPVHRRILYAMRELGLGAGGGFRKSAKISGDVMGNFHPHGDQAIYDAMARLAQDFAVRYPLVDGQGNFGNVDGDNPAASRYTEARLTPAAEALLEGLDEDAVDFRENYDGTLTEPTVLPAAFPNLLANGASGIAVGMATNVPPHNVVELCNACLHLAKTPDARDDTLLKYVQGPDFPTGGVVVEPPESIAQAYRAGRGAFRLRARHEVEKLGRDQWQVVVTELPYQVQKSRLIERIADLIQTRKIPLLADVRDESADDVRIVLEPRSRNVDRELLMNMLYRNSDLEIRFSLNMNVLIDGRTPRVCSLKEVLRAWLDHRREVLLRRSRHRLERIDRRLEALEGLLVAYLHLDRVIDIIRYDDDPKAALMREKWSREFRRAASEKDYRTPPRGAGELTEAQADAILNMRLRSLRRLQEMEIRSERAALAKERKGVKALLGDPARQWKRISEQVREVRDAFAKDPAAGPRRTTFEEAAEAEEVPLEAMIEREPVTIVCSRMGWIRAMNGHVDLSREFRFRDGDGPRFAFHAETTDKLLLFGANGRFYTLSPAGLPGGRGMGEPVRLMIGLPNDSEIVALFVHRPGGRLLVASHAGNGFVVPEAEVVAQTRSGKQALNVGEGGRAQVCVPAEGDHVATVGENGKLLVFPLGELPEMARGKGVRLQKFAKGGLSDASVFALKDGLGWRDTAGRSQAEADVSAWKGKRAGAGLLAPKRFPRGNRFA